MISRILQNFSQVALDFATLNIGNISHYTFKSTWMHYRPTVALWRLTHIGHFIETKGNLQQSKASNAQKQHMHLKVN